MMLQYTDNTLMPFGKYKGTKLANIPSRYLLFIYDKTDDENLKDYIDDNREVFNEEAKIK